jgi:drug/metabolite transporter (DMT)-like permease
MVAFASAFRGTSWVLGLQFTSPGGAALTSFHVSRRACSFCRHQPPQMVLNSPPKPVILPMSEKEQSLQDMTIFAPLAPSLPVYQPEPVSRGLWSYAWPRALLVLVAGLWGTNFACVKLVGESMTPADGSLARFGLAALALIPSLFIGPKIGGSSQRENALPPGLLLDGIRCGFWVFIGYMTQSIALETTDAGKSAFICSLAVVFVPFITSILNGLSSTVAKGPKPSWLAAGLAAVGVGFMELGGKGSLDVQAGDWWAFAQMVGFSMGFIENERALSRHPRHPLQMTAIQLSYVAVASVVWAFGAASLRAGGLAMPDLSAVIGDQAMLPVIGAIAFTGLVTTAFTVFIENIALVRVSASEMAIILSTEPLFATVFAAFLLKETVGKEAAVGGGLIMLACLMNQVKTINVRHILPPALANLVWFLGDGTKNSL